MGQSTSEKETLLAYKGPFSIQVLSHFGNYIKEIFKDNDQIQSKAYKIFFELTQNVAYYSAERRSVNNSQLTGIGNFILEENEDFYLMQTINIINKADIDTLENYCKQVNSLDISNLRKLKAERRKDHDIKDSGAHVGIIQICIIAGCPVEFEFIDYDAFHSLYSISTKIFK